MVMETTIGISVLLALLGIWGLFRGVQLGAMSLVGTLLAVVVVDLWNVAWIYWLDRLFRVSPISYWHFGAASLAFVAVVFFVGYGSGVLLPAGAVPKKKSIVDRLFGGLLGVVNGALIAAFLIHYAYEMIGSEQIGPFIKSVPLANILRWWLPWFVLATVVMLFLAVVARTFYFFFKARKAASATAAAKKQASADKQPGALPGDTPAAEAKEAANEPKDTSKKKQPQRP